MEITKIEIKSEHQSNIISNHLIYMEFSTKRRGSKLAQKILLNKQDKIFHIFFDKCRHASPRKLQISEQDIYKGNQSQIPYNHCALKYKEKF